MQLAEPTPLDRLDAVAGFAERHTAMWSGRVGQAFSDIAAGYRSIAAELAGEVDAVDEVTVEDEEHMN